MCVWSSQLNGSWANYFQFWQMSISADWMAELVRHPSYSYLPEDSAACSSKSWLRVILWTHHHTLSQQHKCTRYMESHSQLCPQIRTTLCSKWISTDKLTYSIQIQMHPDYGRQPCHRLSELALMSTCKPSLNTLLHLQAMHVTHTANLCNAICIHGTSWTPLMLQIDRGAGFLRMSGCKHLASKAAATSLHSISSRSLPIPNTLPRERNLGKSCYYNVVVRNSIQPYPDSVNLLRSPEVNTIKYLHLVNSQPHCNWKRCENSSIVSWPAKPDAWSIGTKNLDTVKKTFTEC